MAEQIVHEFGEGADGKLRLLRVNPLRRWVDMAKRIDIQWQGGQFLDRNFNPIPLTQVPPEIQDEVRRNPVRAAPIEAPEVVTVCEVCAETMNQSLLNGHMVQHVREAEAAVAAAKADREEAEAKFQNLKPNKPGKAAQE